MDPKIKMNAQKKKFPFNKHPPHGGATGKVRLKPSLTFSITK